MSKTPELLSCPFCGSQAKTMLDTYSDHGQIIHIFRVYCFFSRCVVIERTNIDKDIAEYKAIKKWNTRVYPPKVQAAIERDTPKRPDFLSKISGICPCCGCIVDYVCCREVCPECGQRMDWSEE